jgi:hypothetical protein
LKPVKTALDTAGAGWRSACWGSISAALATLAAIDALSASSLLARIGQDKQSNNKLQLPRAEGP